MSGSTRVITGISHQEVNFSCSGHLIEGFTLSSFLRKETLGIISHNCNIMSETVIGSNPEVIYVST